MEDKSEVPGLTSVELLTSVDLGAPPVGDEGRTSRLTLDGSRIS